MGKITKFLPFFMIQNLKNYYLTFEDDMVLEIYLKIRIIKD